MTDPSAAGSLTQREFDQIRTLAYRQFGLDLPDAKKQLVSTRLGKKVRELNLRSFHDYYQHVVEDRTGAALIAMIDALTTNHTSFFREPAHFEFLRQTILPNLQSRGRIEIWRASWRRPAKLFIPPIAVRAFHPSSCGAMSSAAKVNGRIGIS
jgi:hypothetical protein